MIGREASAQFFDKGWTIVRGFFTAEESAAIAEWCHELATMPEIPGRHMVYGEPSRLTGERIIQRIENFCPFHSGFDALARSGRLPAAVGQLLETPSCLFKDKINYKLPGGGGFEPHQDQQAGWSAWAPLFITALVSIDEATLANGCLEIADMPKLRALIGAEWQPLTPAEMQGVTLESIATAPGDVIFFDSFVPHASKPNMSADGRRVLYLTYNRLSDGDHRVRYFAEKRASFPPDIERIAGKEYRFRV